VRCAGRRSREIKERAGIQGQATAPGRKGCQVGHDSDDIRDLDDIYATPPESQQLGPLEEQEEMAASTTPSLDTWSERPTVRLSEAQPPIWAAATERPEGLGQRLLHASRKAQLGISFGTLLFLFFFAVLIAGALSSGGALRLPETDKPGGSSLQVWPGMATTPTPRLVPPVTGAPTSTPDSARGGAGGTGAPPTPPTPTRSPSATSTPGPKPTATATPAPTPTNTPAPTPTVTPSPTPTATPAPTPTDTPAPTPTQIQATP
jgi:hypothetical protein